MERLELSGVKYNHIVDPQYNVKAVSSKGSCTLPLPHKSPANQQVSPHRTVRFVPVQTTTAIQVT